MAGQAALVTGGALRLGRAMVLKLASRGCDIALHYANSAQAAEQTASEVRTFGVNAVTLQADLLVEAEVAGLISRATSALGKPLTILVNNASIFEYDTLETASRKSWDRHMESNLRAPFVLIQEFARQVPAPLPDARNEPLAQGVVVNMIDQRVLKPTPEFMTYTLAKMRQWALTRTAAQALAPEVRVNAIGPGPTMQGIRQSAEHFDRQRRATILERGADPDDITAALAFILDAKALTGQILCIDGGQHLGWKTPDVLGVE